MLPRRTWIWQRNSQPTASGKPGAVQTVIDIRRYLKLHSDLIGIHVDPQHDGAVADYHRDVLPASRSVASTEQSGRNLPMDVIIVELKHCVVSHESPLPYRRDLR